MRRMVRRMRSDGAVRYSGDFKTWDEARRRSTGYDAAAIVEKVKQAALKVQRGEAACERDSVAFDRIEHSFPLLVGLLRAALLNGGRLNVVDIGGSLGSTYFQCRGILEDVAYVRWNVVEQPLFAACGREFFQDERVRFFDDSQTCMREQAEPPNVLLLSSVLPYVESPHRLLDEVVQHGIPHVIVDRTPLWPAPDRLTVQSVPPSIYGFAASYPAWILNRERLLRHFEPAYRIVLEFDALAGSIDVDGAVARDTGFILHRPHEYTE